LILAEMDAMTVINGDGTQLIILEQANVGDIDVAIALTNCDDDNLVICELCKKRFNAKKTVSIVNDPNKTEFFHKMGIDSVICSTSAITGMIEQQAFMD